MEGKKWGDHTTFGVRFMIKIRHLAVFHVLKKFLTDCTEEAPPSVCLKHRLFIASVDQHNQAQAEVSGQHRGPSVGEEGEGDPDNRKDHQAHSNVDDDLERQHGEDSGADVLPNVAAAHRPGPEHPPADDGRQDDRAFPCRECV